MSENSLRIQIAGEINKHLERGYNIVCFCFSEATLKEIMREANLIYKFEFPHSIFGIRVAVNDDDIDKDFVLVKKPHGLILKRIKFNNGDRENE